MSSAYIDALTYGQQAREGLSPACNNITSHPPSFNKTGADDEVGQWIISAANGNRAQSQSALLPGGACSTGRIFVIINKPINRDSAEENVKWNGSSYYPLGARAKANDLGRSFNLVGYALTLQRFVLRGRIDKNNCLNWQKYDGFVFLRFDYLLSYLFDEILFIHQINRTARLGRYQVTP